MKKYLLFLIIGIFAVLITSQAHAGTGAEFKGFTLGKPLPKGFNQDNCWAENVGSYCVKNTTVVGIKTRLVVFLIENNGSKVIYGINAKYTKNVYNNLKYAFVKKYGAVLMEESNPFIKSIKTSIWVLGDGTTQMVLKQSISETEIYMAHRPLLNVVQKMRLEYKSNDL